MIIIIQKKQLIASSAASLQVSCLKIDQTDKRGFRWIWFGKHGSRQVGEKRRRRVGLEITEATFQAEEESRRKGGLEQSHFYG